MKIHAHIIAWNEERILPYTLDYYSSICEKIFVYDNMSTDSSHDIYKRYEKVKVILWDSKNEINEMNYIKLKSLGYREHSRDCDWVIVCDCDEFLYHPNLEEKLAEYKALGINVPKVSGHDMATSSFPVYEGDKKFLTDIVKVGSELYEPMCKSIVFDPKLDIVYGVGAHSLFGDNIVYSEDRSLKLLHYKFLGFDYVKDLYEARAVRLSAFNKSNKFGEHYYHVPINYMNKLLTENNIVI